MKNLKLLFPAIIIIFFAGSCSLDEALNLKQSAIIDNPTDKTITCIIDGDMRITLEPETFQAIELKKGTHTVKIEGGEEHEFKQHADEEIFILNPTRSDYIVWSELYSSDDYVMTAHDEYMNAKSVTLDDEDYDGPFDLFNSVMITKIWNFGLNQDFPEEVTLYNNIKSSRRSKIYRKKDFIKAYEEWE